MFSIKIKLKKTYISLLSLLLLASLSLTVSCSTVSPEISQDNSLTRNVELTPELLAKLEQKRIKKLEHPKRYDQPKEAQQFFVDKRTPKGEGTYDTQLLVQAAAQADMLPQYAVPQRRVLPSRSAMRSSRAGIRSLGAWDYHGPGNIGGRSRALIIHPTTPSIMYAGGVAGGVWKSTDAGTSWTPLTDLLSNLAISTMAMSPHDSNTLYAGTGEGFFNIDAVRGAGIFKTTDAGASWTLIASTTSSDFYYVNKIVVSPNNANTVYAATRTGVWRSTNAGGSWTRVLNTSQSPYYHSSGCLDLVVRTDLNPDALIVAAGNTFDSSSGALYRSTNGGDSWSQVYTETELGRCSLAIAPSNQSYIYALAASQESGNYQYGLLAVLRSEDGGATWGDRVRNTDSILLNTALLSNPLYAICYSTWLNQGWYDNVIAVDPLNPDIVWAGGVDLFRSDNGGQDWLFASAWWTSGYGCYAHADHHAIVFHPDYDGSTNQSLFTGNDGGLFRTGNARGLTQSEDFTCSPSYGGPYVTWTSLNNGFGVTQFYHGTVFPGGQAYMGGTQDNGTLAGEDNAPNSWEEVYGGDGGYTAINPQNTDIQYCETTRLSIKKSTDGGANFSPAISGITESSSNFQFIAPFTMAPSNPDHLWTGGRYLWRTTDAATNWTQASALLPGSKSLSSIAVDPGDTNHVVAGMGDGYIAYSTSALSTTSASSWSYSRPATGWISSIAFDPNNTQNVYATCSTYGQGHVWKSTNGGSSWTNITNGLPDVPAHSVAVDPGDSTRLFAGTDLGVFVSTDGGSSWNRSNDQFANVITEHLAVESESNRLFAFTHGRGVYSASLGATATLNMAPVYHLLNSSE